MRVKSVELINIKSYDKVKIELSEGLNILIGENNSGKSTIIQALLNLQYYTFHQTNIRALTDYSKIYTEIVKIEKSEIDSFYNRNFPTELEYKESFTVAWGIGANSTSEEFLYYDSNLKVKRVAGDRVMLDTNYGLKDIKFKQFGRFSDKEDHNNFIYPFLARRKTQGFVSTSSREDSFRVSENLNNLAAKIQKISNPTHPYNSKFEQLCKEILGFTVGVIPSEQNSGIEAGIYVSEISTIPLKNMGEGVVNIVGFLVTLLTENNKLYLVEEIENDIHPKALKSLLTLILDKSKNNQFVISTHSHIVLKYLAADNKTKLFRTEWTLKNLGGLNVPTSEIELIKNTPDNKIDLLKKLGYETFDFEMYNAYLILEESTAERVIRDFLIPYFVPQLYNRIKTIAANGIDDVEARFIDFHRLFVYLHTKPIYYKKAWVLVDGDSVGVNTCSKLIEKFKGWPREHFITLENDSFEKYYPARFQNDVKKVLGMVHGKEKQKAKANLLDELMKWAFKNQDLALVEFKESFSEVISKLKMISKAMD